jgi:hypothetical protein
LAPVILVDGIAVIAAPAPSITYMFRILLKGEVLLDLFHARVGHNVDWGSVSSRRGSRGGGGSGSGISIKKVTVGTLGGGKVLGVKAIKLLERLEHFRLDGVLSRHGEP